MDERQRQDLGWGAGWRDDPDRPGVQRYWSGSDWDDTIAPRSKPTSPWKYVWIVVAGVIGAVALLWIFLALQGPSELDCDIQRLEVETGERATVDPECG